MNDDVVDPNRPQLVAITQGQALGPGTWSGSSASLFGEFSRRGQLTGSIDMSLSPPLEQFARGVTVHPNVRTWRSRSSLGRARAAMSAHLVQRQLDRIVADRRVDCTLQVGSWSPAPRLSDEGVRAAYLDSAIAQLLQRTDSPILASSRFAQWRSDFEREVYADLDVVFVMSEWTKSSLVTDLAVPADKVVVARPGPNGSSYTESVVAPERAPWRSAKGPHLLFIGKKWERKGGPVLLEAFRLLRKACPSARLSIIGPDNELPTAPGVVNWGRLNRERPSESMLFEHLLASADLFVMPSNYEPFGIVFLEAMSRGIATVGVNRCAMPEIIADGTTGRLVAPSDVNALADALISLAEEPDVIARMGDAARLRASRLYSWQSCVDTMNRTFTDLLTSRSAAAR